MSLVVVFVGELLVVAVVVLEETAVVVVVVGMLVEWVVWESCLAVARALFAQIAVVAVLGESCWVVVVAPAVFGRMFAVAVEPRTVVVVVAHLAVVEGTAAEREPVFEETVVVVVAAAAAVWAGQAPQAVSG